MTSKTPPPDIRKGGRSALNRDIAHNRSDGRRQSPQGKQWQRRHRSKKFSWKEGSRFRLKGWDSASI